MRWLLRSKIHKATVTDANVEYIGSLEIDQDLIEKAGLWPGEKVLVSSLNTGERLETYVITAKMRFRNHLYERRGRPGDQTGRTGDHHGV